MLKQRSKQLALEQALYLHRSVLPELVDPWEDGDGSVPDVASVVHLAALHLHLCILQPQSDVPVIHIQCALVDGASPESREMMTKQWQKVAEC